MAAAQPGDPGNVAGLACMLAALVLALSAATNTSAALQNVTPAQAQVYKEALQSLPKEPHAQQALLCLCSYSFPLW